MKVLPSLKQIKNDLKILHLIRDKIVSMSYVFTNYLFKLFPYRNCRLSLRFFKNCLVVSRRKILTQNFHENYSLNPTYFIMIKKRKLHSVNKTNKQKQVRRFKERSLLRNKLRYHVTSSKIKVTK